LQEIERLATCWHPMLAPLAVAIPSPQFLPPARRCGKPLLRGGFAGLRRGVSPGSGADGIRGLSGRRGWTTRGAAGRPRRPERSA